MVYLLKNLPFYLKCLFYQGGFNLENMQGTGFLWLTERELKKQGIELSQRERESLGAYFNTNPSFISLVAGVFLREMTRKREKAFLLKDSYAAACAALGDSFFWHALKPFLFLISFFVCVYINPLGALLYPIGYALFHLSFIAAGKRVGELLGEMTVGIFNRFRLKEWADITDKISVFILGMLLVKFTKDFGGGEGRGALTAALIFFVLGAFARRFASPIVFLPFLIIVMLVTALFYGG